MSNLEIKQTLVVCAVRAVELALAVEALVLPATRVPRAIRRSHRGKAPLVQINHRIPLRHCATNAFGLIFTHSQQLKQRILVRTKCRMTTLHVLQSKIGLFLKNSQVF
jgi:hypothetical protein